MEWCVLVVFVILTSTSTVFSSRITDGLISLYQFNEGLTNSSATATSDASGVETFGDLNFLGTMGTDWYWLGSSIGARLNSNGSMQSGPLKSIPPGYSLEIWFRYVTLTPSLFSPLLSISNWTFNSSNDNSAGVCPTGNRVNIGFDAGPLGQFDRYYHDDSSCTALLQGIHPIFLRTVNYLMLTTNTSYVNTNCGGTGACTTLTGTTTQWLKFPLQVKPTWSAFTIDVFHIALYNRTLSKSEAAKNFYGWLVNSPPTTQNTYEMIPQDTETVLQLVSDDFDLLAPYPDNLTYYVNTLPANGTLYLNGTVVASVPTAVRRSIDILSYKGPLYKYNFNYTFQFNVSDGKLSSANFVYNIRLVSAPFPPIPNNLTIQITRGLSKLINISCFDPSGQQIIETNVTSLPTVNSTLWLPDGVTPIVSPQNVSSIRYYAGFGLGDEGNYIVQSDEIIFGCRNRYNASVLPGIVTIQITNHLYAFDATYTAIEDVRTTLLLNAGDLTQSSGGFTLRISRGPDHMSFYLSNSSTPLGFPAVINFPPGANTSIDVLGNLNFYGNLTFTYSLEQTIGHETFLSGTATANLTIESFNDPPNVQRIGTLGPISLMAAGRLVTPLSEFIIGFNLSDPDSADSNYTVTIDGFNSTLGELPNGYVEFVVINRTNLTWPILAYSGEDGTSFRKLFFVGSYADVVVALSQILIIGTSSGMCNGVPCTGYGIFHIIVQDRVNTGFLPPPNMQTTWLDITYQVTPFDASLASGAGKQLTKTQHLLIWIGAGVGFLVCCWFCRFGCKQYSAWFARTYVRRDAATDTNAKP